MDGYVLTSLSKKILVQREICSSVEQYPSQKTQLLHAAWDLWIVESGMWSWEQSCVSTFSYNLLTAVMACGTVQTLP